MYDEEQWTTHIKHAIFSHQRSCWRLLKISPSYRLSHSTHTIPEYAATTVQNNRILHFITASGNNLRTRFLLFLQGQKLLAAKLLVCSVSRDNCKIVHIGTLTGYITLKIKGNTLATEDQREWSFQYDEFLVFYTKRTTETEKNWNFL